MKHSLTPKHLLTAKILASVEAAIGRKQDMSIETKEIIRGKVASVLQSSVKPVNNLSKDEQLALSRLRKDDTIVITPADKGRVTVVMNKTEYREKMNNLVKDDRTYKQLKRDPSKKLQRKLNDKLFQLHQANILKKPLYSRLSCSIAQTPKLYGLPKIHKENTPLRPIVSFCSSPSYELSKYLVSILKPLTEKSKHRLINSEAFVARIKNAQINEDHELVSFNVKSLFTSIPLHLAIESVKEALASHSSDPPIPKEEVIDLLTLCWNQPFSNTMETSTNNFTARPVA